MMNPIHRMRRTPGRSGLVAVLTFATLCAPPADELAAQSGPPLPTELVSDFKADEYDFLMWPIGGVDDVDDGLPQLDLAASFDTDGKTLVLEWSFKAPGADWGRLREEVPLGYQPTALCAHAGSGTVFYSAGYSQRLSQVVVQRWEIKDIAIAAAQTQPPAEGQPVSGFSKRLDVETLASSDLISPIVTLTYDLPNGRLWLMEDAWPRTVWSLDPQTLAVDLVRSDAGTPLNASSQPLLAETRWLVSTVMGPGSSAPGFVILALPYASWRTELSGTTDELLVFRDADMDGQMEEYGEFLTWDDYEARGWFEHEVADYADPP